MRKSTSQVLTTIRRGQWAALTGLVETIENAVAKAREVGSVPTSLWNKVAGSEADLRTQVGLYRGNVGDHIRNINQLGARGRREYFEMNVEAIIFDAYALLASVKAWTGLQALHVWRARAAGGEDADDARLADVIARDTRTELESALAETTSLVDALTRELRIIAELPGRATVPLMRNRRDLQAARLTLRFQTEVEAAGHRWPDGWVRGYGYGSPPDPGTTTDFESYGLAYVAQIVELTPGQRSRYQSQIRTLAALTVLEAPWRLPITCTSPSRSSKPSCAPPRGHPRPDHRRSRHRSPVRRAHRSVDRRHRPGAQRLTRQHGQDGEQEIPPWRRKRLRPKHTMRCHHLGKPKTAKSRRTVEYGEVVADVLRRLTDRRANNDFVFVTRARGTSTALRWAGGLPWYQSDFYEGRWVPALAAARAAGLPKAPRFHDLRHTYVAWAVAAGADLPLHPGAARTRVDHHDHRHLRPPDAQLEPARHARISTVRCVGGRSSVTKD